jgi:hypothetical protein
MNRTPGLWEEYTPKTGTVDLRERTNRRFLRQYGISLDEYDQLYKACGGICSCCGDPIAHTLSSVHQRHKAVVDHCHETGKVRGLLCNFCNRTLGNAQDDPAVLRSLAAYVEHHKQTSQTYLTN